VNSACLFRAGDSPWSVGYHCFADLPIYGRCVAIEVWIRRNTWPGCIC